MSRTVAMSGGKGKKRQLEKDIDLPNALEANEHTSIPSKKRRAAETRDCPICSEPIPLRLLAKHAELEAARVDVIIASIAAGDVEDDDGNGGLLESESLEFEQGSSRGRRSALKARKSFRSGPSPTSTLAQTIKTLQTIKRNRKARHGKLRDMTREDDEQYQPPQRQRQRPGEILCPICRTTVRGDQDVLDAHVDACLAGEMRVLDEARMREERLMREEQEAWQTYDLNVVDDGAVGHVGDVTGLGFYTRNAHDRDVDEDIDIDGDDLAFGAAQFNEGDVVGAEEEDEDVNIQDDSDDEDQDQPLQALIGHGMNNVALPSSSSTPQTLPLTPSEEKDPDELDLAILGARKQRNTTLLVVALENKLKFLESQSRPVCRICLDPYLDPSVSTGCWHTCCSGCWLRCLGSTKLCPICKRITSTADLRRVYL